MSSPVSSDKHVGLNVGGKVYRTSRANLTRYANTFFTAILDGGIPSAKDEHGNFMIDRDGKMFRHILNFLRNGELILPEGFNEFKLLEVEADFFLIEEMMDALREKQREMKLSSIPDLIGFTIDGIPRVYKLELRHVLREPNSILSKWTSGEVLLPFDYHGNIIMDGKKRDVIEETYLSILNYLQRGFIAEKITLREAKRLEYEAKFYELKTLASHARSIQQLKMDDSANCHLYYSKEACDAQGSLCIAYTNTDLSSTLSALQVQWISAESFQISTESSRKTAICSVMDFKKMNEKKPDSLKEVISYFEKALGQQLDSPGSKKDGWIEQKEISENCAVLNFRLLFQKEIPVTTRPLQIYW